MVKSGRRCSSPSTRFAIEAMGRLLPHLHGRRLLPFHDFAVAEKLALHGFFRAPATYREPRVRREDVEVVCSGILQRHGIEGKKISVSRRRVVAFSSARWVSRPGGQRCDRQERARLMRYDIISTRMGTSLEEVA